MKYLMHGITFFILSSVHVNASAQMGFTPEDLDAKQELSAIISTIDQLKKDADELLDTLANLRLLAIEDGKRIQAARDLRDENSDEEVIAEPVVNPEIIAEPVTRIGKATSNIIGKGSVTRLGRFLGYKYNE